jgi:hypothetical protein
MTVGGYSTENAVVPPELTLLVPIRCVIALRKGVCEGEIAEGR